MRLGIDASNLRAGGGITHLIEVLSAVKPREHGFERVIIWTGSQAAALLQRISPVFDVRALRVLDQTVFIRLLWQQIYLSRVAAREVDVLFNPGCGYFGSFRPYVTISRNMLPFEPAEIRRFGISVTGLRYAILRWTQTHSIRQADGAVFLTAYAEKVVSAAVGKFRGEVRRIPHGVNPTYYRKPRLQKTLDNYSFERPYRIVYVSTIEYYKHQFAVVGAVANLRRKGYPVRLDLVGRAVPEMRNRLDKVMRAGDPEGAYITMRGALYGAELISAYHDCDLFVFASTCENMPNILIEAMASGLPIVCSSAGPMPEVLGDRGFYCRGDDVASLEQCIERAMLSPEARAEAAMDAFKRAGEYSWHTTAQRTFAFVSEIGKRSLT